MSRTDAVVHACHRCGGDAPYDFGDLWLCLDCYHIAASTCSGIGRPWRSEEATAASVGESGAVC